MPGEPQFHAASGTPTVNGLSGSLLTDNPNLNPANNDPVTGSGATNPFRFDRRLAAKGPPHLKLEGRYSRHVIGNLSWSEGRAA